jgi:hypothetical protein
MALPIACPTSGDPRQAAVQKGLRIAAYVTFFAILILVMVQFQHLTVQKLREDATDSKGAIPRWRAHVHDLWDGENIYETKLHPNTPFVTILLTPLAMLPMTYLALAVSLLKFLAIIATILMAARLAVDGDRKVADWILGLAMLWSLQVLISDLQHGNTNTFVLFFIVLHAWLFRRGQDVLAGGALAMAICLKMTPALFVLYWLYQRQWRLLATTFIWGIVLSVGVPFCVFGPDRFGDLFGTWLDKLIIPGLIKGAWYPIHINQSLSGVISRYFLAGQNGDIGWNPDDCPVYANHVHTPAWITLVTMSESAVRWILRLLQVAVVGLMAWGIGWRKLARTDGRRMLHYGLITLGMMILNQRTWQHHATVTLVTTIAIWQAIAYGRISSRARKWALGLMIAAGPFMWLNASDLYVLAAKIGGQDSNVGKAWADIGDAYGPTLMYFLIMLICGVVLLRGLRNSDPAYAITRQKLSDGITPPPAT